MTRKKEREQAFCLIFEKSFRDESCEEIISLAKDIRDFEITDYISLVFTGVYDNLEKIDDIISSYLKSWTINRIQKTDLALLRLGIYELLFCDDIPESVTINEIVELAKTYSEEKNSSYINGVLGSVVKNENKRILD